VSRFQPERMFRVLEAHGVRYVLVGGLAATLHGSPLLTGDSLGDAFLEQAAMLGILQTPLEEES
jgi:hypothetical protein